ncbi:DNA primase [Flavobacterium sp. F52]|uniref:DNA primase n=1 Tax=Flavobacterium sp. F52 TaxID=1202532 RepID=UPI000272DFBE|nr:DNA primase [Flavobacterium sp. F52]EJG02262.1 DNA primase [Flavobacterium sp. F52]
MYTEKSIDLVRNADIVQIIGHFCELKKSGSRYTCESPFNHSKDSFYVTPSLNMYKCFSTGKGGDGISFVQTYKNVDFAEAVKVIGGICNIVLEETEISEEERRLRTRKQSLYDIQSVAALKYEMQLHNALDDHWVKKMLISRDINEETVEKFRIGYAPKDYKFITNPLLENGKLEQAVAVGLTVSKDGSNYDFHRDKLLFPIRNIRGNIVAFGGRRADNADGPKYINTAQTEIYEKSHELYGLYENKDAISKQKTAVLVEGYTDVTGLSQFGCELGVATGGTALSEIQCKLLHRFADHVIICRDNDGLDEKGNEQKGTLAALKDVNMLLAVGLKVSVVILPEGEDPDSYARKTPHVEKMIFGNAEDAVNWKTIKLKNRAANDPNELSYAVSEIALMLSQIKDDIKREAYLKQCAKIIKQPAKVIKDKIESFYKIAEAKAAQTEKVHVESVEKLGLPVGAEYKQFLEKGFVIHQNNVYFRGKDSFYKGTNFRITPLFHVYGKQENKRLCEVISESGIKRLIDFDTADFSQMTKFEVKLLDEGNFTFTSQVSANQFKLLRNEILGHFITAHELKTLGWQHAGFYAYANLIYHNGVTKVPNDYGIVQLETGVKVDSDYIEDVKHFYSPSASVMYKNSREGDDPYENDRYMVYMEAPIAFHTWMKQMHKVYGKKAVTGIACAFFALFRDLFVKTYQVSPLLFLAGEKGSGKSKFAESLAAMFCYKQPAFDLNAGTISAFSRRISRTTNTIALLEEFSDLTTDVKIKQSIKGSYDNRGREIGQNSGDNKTKVTKVNCFLILLSQYLSSWDDNSITSRSIIEHVIKPQENYTDQEVADYNLLQSWEEEGITSFVLEIVKYRTLVEENYRQVYSDIIKQLKKELRGVDYQERMLQNYTVILTPIKILFDKFKFPFTYQEMHDQFKENIIETSDLIVESEGLAEFWKTLEYLRDRKPFALLIENIHFMIDTPISLKLQGRKDQSSEEWPNKDRSQVLYLRLNAVHQLYHKEVSTREGVDVIHENTLRNYFKSKKYFIGAVKSVHFDDTSTSAYVFNYSMMHENGILNLLRNSPKKSDDAQPKVPVSADAENDPDWLKAIEQ